ncbi:MAG: hypothetical protein CPSOU_6768 [uncultured Paraburkholderia sp.]|nr:MAG: hypothetical protein CPSOU_6768 [uncultured Paraburkholderia sp.]
MGANSVSTNPGSGTPTVVVRNNRALAVRTLTYNRESADDTPDERIERTTYDPAGWLQSRIDPRFFGATGSPNFVYVSSLSGQTLRTDSVDAGTQWALANVDGRPVWARHARGTVMTWTYDALGRPLTVTEAGNGDPPAVRDVWCYGEAEPDAQAHNLRGQCVRCYDTAGQLVWSGFRLTGEAVDETRRLLADAEAEADWSGQNETMWERALEPTGYQTA